MAARAKPTPRTVSEVCSLCGLDWKLHGKEPTTETCIRLLAQEIAFLRSQLASRPITYPVPVYPRPWPYGQPFYPHTVWNQTAATSSGYLQPLPSNATPRAIAASSTC